MPPAASSPMNFSEMNSSQYLSSIAVLNWQRWNPDLVSRICLQPAVSSSSWMNWAKLKQKGKSSWILDIGNGQDVDMRLMNRCLRENGAEGKSSTYSERPDKSAWPHTKTHVNVHGSVSNRVELNESTESCSQLCTAGSQVIVSKAYPFSETAPISPCVRSPELGHWVWCMSITVMCSKHQHTGRWALPTRLDCCLWAYKKKHSQDTLPQTPKVGAGSDWSWFRVRGMAAACKQHARKHLCCHYWQHVGTT